MLITRCFLLCLLLLSAPIMATEKNAQFNIPLFTAHYDLYAYNIKVATAVRQLRRQQQQYVLTTDTKTIGVVSLFRNDTIKEKSVWEWKNGVIQPQHYSYKHDSKKKKRYINIDFDWVNR